MSVFNDFQRLWMQRFPQSSLSDAWEQDVRASLERHKLKINELTKELEQETLYVEYLERLLLDVEKFRETGGDPTTLFEAATTANNATTIPQHLDNEAYADNGAVDAATANVFTTKSSLNLRESNNENKDKTNRLSLNTDNKYASNNNQSGSSNSNASAAGGGGSGSGSGNGNSSSGNGNGNGGMAHGLAIGSGNGAAIATAANTRKSTPQSSEEQSYDKEDKDVGTEKETNNEKNGALHAQCITELAATISASQSVDRQRQQKGVSNDSQQQQPNGTNKSVPQKTASTTTPAAQHNTSQFITRIEIKESKANNEKDMVGTIEESDYENSPEVLAATNTFTSFERKPTAPPLSPALTSPAMSASSYATHLADKNKKMPPRPPPKNIRRVEPPTVPGPLSSSPKRDSPFSGSTVPLPNSATSSYSASSVSPGSSLERNIKPSDIYRQKSSDSYMANRKTATDMSKFPNAPELMEELGRKVGKSESLEKTKRADTSTHQSPTGSLGRTVTTTTTTTTSRNITPGMLTAAKTSPTGSLSKANNVAKLTTPESSSTGSLDKKSRSSLQAENAVSNVVGSKESLASQGISEIIKSYESVSSLSSDSAKAAQVAESEPYYDSVPLDNGDGEYVYIKPGRAGSSSSRDDLSTPGSTLPMCATNATHLSSQASVTDPESPGRTNYVNIDYFLQQSNETRSSSIDSDGEYDGPPIMRTISHDEQTSQTPGALRKNLVSAILSSNNARGAKIRSILSSIIHSESIYVECLNKMIQYKRAIHATIGTSKPVINEEDENTIFFNIEELYAQHTAFLNDLKAIVAIEGGDVLIGDAFKRLADMFEVYTAFLHNYNQAIETVKKCSASNTHFKDIVSTIVLNLQTEQSLTLEDLLHKPVARVQIIALVFNDLLRETPSHHRDYLALQEAQKTIHRVLQEFKVGSQSNNLRRMVKNSFIVELVDGHRKLRHLFLFHDVLACAKYKASGRDRFEYELKWFIPVKDVHVETDTAIDLKEASPANIMQLKSHACSTRSQLLAEEKEKNGVRASDKLRRRLAELETQLVLASPNLVFRLGNKTTNKPYTFFLSSDFERTQWIDSILSLQQSYNLPSANVINTLEMRALIVAIPKLMKTEMGSYLMRDTKDESLLVGDLYLTVQSLNGLKQLADLYVCLEVDSYGHYFRKATTKMVCRSMNPMWNESFVLELDGSQNVRVLLYEAQERPMLKAKHVLKLSRSWLRETEQCKVLKMGEAMTLNIVIRFVHGNYRVPTSKPGVLFGVKMSQVLKREKRNIPFIISACIREVEHRGLAEVGIYRVSGSASDLARLKKSFESNAFEAEQLLKDVDIHSVTGILKSYLRELPEALFTDLLYPKFFETFNAFSNNNETARINELLKIFDELPQPNKESINLILDHLIRVHNKEADNKMSLHNLAMVFGPTLLRPGQQQTKQKDMLASSTVDVMAQAGILYCFLQARIRKD